MLETNLQALRIDLAKRSRWNIGYFGAGLIFWLHATAIGAFVPLELARIYWLVGSFFIFPMAILLSRIIGADPFTKGNSLADLVGYTHMSVIALTFPILMAAFLYFPQALVFVMAIAYCLDFYVMTWAFGSRLFGLHAAFRVITVSVIWFALPDGRTTVLPATVAVAYLVTVILLPALRRRWLVANA